MNVKTQKEVHYLHSAVHTGCLIPDPQNMNPQWCIDPTMLLSVHTKQTKLTQSCKAMSNKLFLMELVLFLMYLALLGVSVLSLTYLPSLIVLIRILRMVLVISQCFLFLQERRLRKRIRLLNKKSFPEHAYE